MCAFCSPPMCCEFLEGKHHIFVFAIAASPKPFPQMLSSCPRHLTKAIPRGKYLEVLPTTGILFLRFIFCVCVCARMRACVARDVRCPGTGVTEIEGHPASIHASSTVLWSLMWVALPHFRWCSLRRERDQVTLDKPRAPLQRQLYLSPVSHKTNSYPDMSDVSSYQCHIYS